MDLELRPKYPGSQPSVLSIYTESRGEGNGGLE